MGNVATNVFQCGFIEDPIPGPPGADAVVYDIDISPSAWCLNADGTVPFESLYVDFPKVKVYKTTGSVREDVTKETYGTAKTLSLKMIADGTETASRLVWVNTSADYHYRIRPINSDGLGYGSIRLELWEGETLWATADCSISQAGQDGLQGEKGPFTPPVQQWSDFPIGFQFTDGSGPDTPKYFVLHGLENASGKFVLYECIKSHAKMINYSVGGGTLGTVVKGTEPGTTPGSEYWKPANNTFSVVATEVLLAMNAFIDFLSSRGLRFYGTDNQACGEFLGGSDIIGWLGGTSANPMWAVTQNGVQTVGGTSGQRIELDPSQKAMFVYDVSGNLVATHSGRRLTVADAKPADSAAVTGSKGISIPEIASFTPTSTYTASHSQGFAVCSGTATAGDAILTVTVPSYRLEVGYAQGAGSGADTDKVGANLYLDITVDGETRRYGLGGVSKSGAESGGTVLADTQQRTAQASVPKGKAYSVKLTLEYYAHNTSGRNGYFRGSSGTASHSLSTQIYRCEYGANGWVISQNSQNYAYLIVDSSGVLHFKVMSGGATKIEC